MVYNWSYDDGPRVPSKRMCMEYIEKKGNLIEETLKGTFDVVTHGCNCYCVMGAGIAVKFRDIFEANKFKLEGGSYKGDFNKLGQIDFERRAIRDGHVVPRQWTEQLTIIPATHKEVYIVNSYTQYGPGISGKYGIPLDYDALRLCLRKINKEFKGMHVGMPRIGCGLAQGDWKQVSLIIKEELIDCKVTVMTL